MTSDEMHNLLPAWHALTNMSQLAVGAVLTGPAFRYFWHIVAVNPMWVTIEKVAPQTDGSYCWQHHIHLWREEAGFLLCCCGMRQEQIQTLLPPKPDITRAYIGEPS